MSKRIELYDISKGLLMSMVVIGHIITIVIAISNGKVGMNLCEFNNPFLYIIGSVSGTMIFLFLSHFIHSKILLYIGKNSLVILATHLNVIVIIEKILQVTDLNIQLWIPAFLVVIIFEILFITGYKKLQYVINKGISSLQIK